MSDQKKRWAVAISIHTVQVVEAETLEDAEEAAKKKLATEILDGTSREIFLIVNKRIEGAG